jgi:mRNA interferase RelE/StbE
VLGHTSEKITRAVYIHRDAAHAAEKLRAAVAALEARPTTTARRSRAIRPARATGCARRRAMLERHMPIWHMARVHSIVYSRDALKSLARMPASVTRLVREKLRALAADPHGPQPQAKRLKGSPLFRLRVGDWRVLYRVDEATRTIAVVDVRPRGGAYD